MLAKSGRSIAPALALLAFATAGHPARAQNIFNPYGNSGYADYREFARPEFNNDPSLPGQARLQSQSIGGRPQANQFEAFSNSLASPDTEATEGTRNGRPAAGPGVPYFQAYRQYDEQYKRIYKPNDSIANRKYEDLLKKRDAAYAKALDERDPVKRARMIRQIEQASIYRPSLPSTPRPASAGRTATSAPRASTTPSPAGSTSRTPAPGAATRAARSLMPATSAAPAAVAPAATTQPAVPAPASDPSSVPIPPPR